MQQDERTALTLAADLTVAWLANPSTRAGADDVPTFLSAVHATLNELSADGGSATAGKAATGAVSLTRTALHLMRVGL